MTAYHQLVVYVYHRIDKLPVDVKNLLGNGQRRNYTTHISEAIHRVAILFPIPVNLSNWRSDALIPFNSIKTDRFVSSGNCWKARLFVTPVFSLISNITWLSKGRPFDVSYISRHATSSDKEVFTRSFSLSLIPQHYYKLNFLSSWATKSCPRFCPVEEFTYLSVAK